jgi:hypothetical protein
MRINEIDPTLKEKGLFIEHLTGQGEDKSRGYRIRKTASPSSLSSPEEKREEN